jgi:hypothetical protein
MEYAPFIEDLVDDSDLIGRWIEWEFEHSKLCPDPMGQWFRRLPRAPAVGVYVFVLVMNCTRSILTIGKVGERNCSRGGRLYGDFKIRLRRQQTGIPASLGNSLPGWNEKCNNSGPRGHGSIKGQGLVDGLLALGLPVEVHVWETPPTVLPARVECAMHEDYIAARPDRANPLPPFCRAI